MFFYYFIVNENLGNYLKNPIMTFRQDNGKRKRNYANIPFGGRVQT